MEEKSGDGAEMKRVVAGGLEAFCDGYKPNKYTAIGTAVALVIGGAIIAKHYISRDYQRNTTHLEQGR